jgi:hypothetical protein
MIIALLLLSLLSFVLASRNVVVPTLIEFTWQSEDGQPTIIDRLIIRCGDRWLPFSNISGSSFHYSCLDPEGIDSITLIRGDAHLAHEIAPQERLQRGVRDQKIALTF